METSTAAQTALGATALAAGVAAAAAPAASADLADIAEELTASADVEIVSESHEFTESAGASEAAEENDAQEIVDKTNDIRAAHGLDELTPSEELTEGSEQWAQVMSSTNTVEHAEGDFGENLHWTSQQVPTDEVVQDWMDSPDHRTNILDPEATEIGAGVVHDSNGMHSVQRFI
ncbi:CAP domain-containing protein [Corynebacterium mastitidis]|uniref:CAP domain-containing protein n=1 Tax=Corynebacterium mastitidis TaxID=161890 RepID=UPI0030E9CEDE